MKQIKTRGKRPFFQVLHSTRSAQVAISTLRKGQATSDEPTNEHPSSEQWLYVVSGRGEVVVEKGGRKRKVKLSPGAMVLIEKGETHQIRQTGVESLVTLNFYAPPAYRKNGQPRWSIRGMLVGS
jgi:mannose-6-phosphate isomerase-like protein (cupin superfamily)